MNEFTQDPVAAPALVLRRHEYSTPHKTAVIVGIPQGGTSMLAAITHVLGGPISERFWNFEPDDRPCCNDNEASWVAKKAGIDIQLDIWAFKDSLIWRFSPEAIHAYLRNPYYLMIARDVAGVATRRAVNHGVKEPPHLMAVLKEAEAQVRRMWDWVYALPEAPILLVSYERALRKRKEVCEAVAAFLRFTPTADVLKRAVARISEVGGYLKKEDWEHE